MNRDSSTGSLSYDLDRGFCLEAFNFAGVGVGVSFFFFPPTSFLFSTEIPHQCLDL